MSTSHTDAELNIRDFNDYKEYLRRALPTTGVSRGVRARLAQTLGFQAAFVSQVLQGEGHFTAEHVLGIAKFLDLSQSDTMFLMLLVMKERALTDDLRHFFKGILIKEFKTKEMEKPKEYVDLSDHDLVWSTYFSSWLYAAIHTLTAISGFQSARTISDYLDISIDRVQSYLDFLAQFGFVSYEGGKYFPARTFEAKSGDSPLSAKHHVNWRMRSIQTLEQGTEGRNLHYTSILTLSAKDAERIREILNRSLNEIDQISKDSRDEEVYSITLDFFQI